MQLNVDAAEVKILSFELTDLTYLSEVKQFSLVNQHAKALIEARMEIVTAAVDIIDVSVQNLTEKGIHCPKRERLRGADAARGLCL